MKYEVLAPGDGMIYPFVWDWSNNIENCSIKDHIYISIANGRFCSGFFKFNPETFTIVEICQCSPEQALAIRSFINNKFEQRK